MSVENKLEYLEGTKEAIKQALIDRGIEVSNTDTFRSYADKIINYNNLTIYPKTELEINKNGYYNSHNSKNITAYSGWDYTSIVDVSDVNYIALNVMDEFQYSYYLGNYSRTNYFAAINNEAFRIYDITGTDEIGFSARGDILAPLKMYKVKENNIALPKVIIEE